MAAADALIDHGLLRVKLTSEGANSPGLRRKQIDPGLAWRAAGGMIPARFAEGSDEALC